MKDSFPVGICSFDELGSGGGTDTFEGGSIIHSSLTSFVSTGFESGKGGSVDNDSARDLSFRLSAVGIPAARGYEA